jgi:long-subunit acyl-CoA synthetase (AMP-forming)
MPRSSERSPATFTESAITWRHGPSLPSKRAHTVNDLMAACVTQHADAVVITDGVIRASWRDLDAWSARVAHAWSSQLVPGERCVVLLPNGIPHLIAELACWRLGVIAVPLFLGFSAERIHELIDHVAPRLIIADIALTPTSATYVVCTSADVWRIAHNGTSIGTVDRPVAANDVCLMQFTSGSTDIPRGVLLTHDNLASQQAAFALHWPTVGPGDRLAAYLPWHHSFGALAERLWALCRGVSMTLIPAGGRDRVLLVKTIQHVAPTIFMSVPKIHALIKQENLFKKNSMRFVFTAGAPLPADIRQWYVEQDIPLCEGWGLTETSPCCTLTVPSLARDFASGLVGNPIAGVSVGVRHSDQHIVVRGPNVMRGYYQRATPNLQDGVLDTGDLGCWTTDGLQLQGRADHQLKLGNGEKVSAEALENALYTCAGIRHVVVAAEPELVAIVELHSGFLASTVHGAIQALNAMQDIPYHRISAVFIMTQPMTIENNLLTASLKVSRARVLQAFRAWQQQDSNALFERI